MVTAFEKLTNFCPIERRRIHAESYPAMLARVGRQEKTGVLEEDALHQLADLERNAEFALVFLQHRKAVGEGAR